MASEEDNKISSKILEILEDQDITQKAWKSLFDLANSHIFTILIAVISTTLTTLVGVVIGSSIEKK